MLSREEIITLLRQNYPYLAAEYGLKIIGLFGSHAVGNLREKNEIDLVVGFARPIGFRLVELPEYSESIGPEHRLVDPRRYPGHSNTLGCGRYRREHRLCLSGRTKSS